MECVIAFRWFGLSELMPLCIAESAFMAWIALMSERPVPRAWLPEMRVIIVLSADPPECVRPMTFSAAIPIWALSRSVCS